MASDALLRKARSIGTTDDGRRAPYALAHLVKVATPDTLNSAGSVFLCSVFEDWLERLDSDLEDGATLDTLNYPSIVRDVSSRFMSTLDTWRVWTDLCLWQWYGDHSEDYGLTVDTDNLGDTARAHLEVLAQLLVLELFEVLQALEVKR